MDKNLILDRLRYLKPVLQEKYGVSQLALFGSYSRSEQTAQSDIDILIDFNKPVGIEFLDVVYLLRESFAGVPVQVVSRQGIKEGYFKHLQKDLLYA